MVDADWNAKTADEAMKDILKQDWYVRENDLIGGWAVMNGDFPPSESDFRKGKWTVADFIYKEHAEHIVEIHNTWLHEQEH